MISNLPLSLPIYTIYSAKDDQVPCLGLNRRRDAQAPLPRLEGGHLQRLRRSSASLPRSMLVPRTAWLACQAGRQGEMGRAITLLTRLPPAELSSSSLDDKTLHWYLTTTECCGGAETILASYFEGQSVPNCVEYANPCDNCRPSPSFLSSPPLGTNSPGGSSW